jgi:large subunit ribosomal protein L5
MSRLRELYEKEFAPQLMKHFGWTNRMQVPKLQKIVLNMGVGDAAKEQKKIQGALADLTLIAGQQPVVTKARLSIAAFKVREGMSLGVKVTLRGERMYEFLDRMVTIALPRVRDFRGLSDKSFDGQGNYNLGITEQLVFPEINYDKIDEVRGLNVTIVTSARNDEEGLQLLKLLGMPFTSSVKG